MKRDRFQIRRWLKNCPGSKQTTIIAIFQRDRIAKLENH
jgi:hypothetical protein